MEHDRLLCSVASTSIVNELKQADEELNDELKRLEQEDDTIDLLRRHHERFQANSFQSTMNVHMNDLHVYANDIRTKERAQTSVKSDNDLIEQRTNKLNDYWTRIQTKIDNVRVKLQTIPKQRHEFEDK
jgi:chaperonin cofactor prefoldin